MRLLKDIKDWDHQAVNHLDAPIKSLIIHSHKSLSNSIIKTKCSLKFSVHSKCNSMLLVKYHQENGNLRISDPIFCVLMVLIYSLHLEVATFK